MTEFDPPNNSFDPPSEYDPDPGPQPLVSDADFQELGRLSEFGTGCDEDFRSLVRILIPVAVYANHCYCTLKGVKID